MANLLKAAEKMITHAKNALDNTTGHAAQYLSMAEAHVLKRKIASLETQIIIRESQEKFLEKHIEEMKEENARLLKKVAELELEKALMEK